MHGVFMEKIGILRGTLYETLHLEGENFIFLLLQIGVDYAEKIGKDKGSLRELLRDECLKTLILFQREILKKQWSWVSVLQNNKGFYLV